MIRVTDSQGQEVCFCDDMESVGMFIAICEPGLYTFTTLATGQVSTIDVRDCEVKNEVA